MSQKIVWYARGGNIAKMGPFPSQFKAWNALRTVKDGEPIDGGMVWPAEMSAKAKASDT